MVNRVGRRQITQEKLDQIEQALQDGWPAKEIRETFKVGNSTMQHYFKGRAWSPKQIGEHGALQRNLKRSIKS